MFDYVYVEKQIKKYVDDELFKFLSDCDATLAGGALTSIISGKPVNDLDLYFKNKQDVEKFIKESSENDIWFVGHTNKAATFRFPRCKLINPVTSLQEPLKVQLIYGQYYKNHLEIFNDFDFTINMISYDFKTKRFNCDYKAIQHIASRKLIFNPSTRYPITTLIRCSKYEDRGYTIAKRETYKLALAIAKLNMKSYDEVRDQLGSLYGVNLKNLFKDDVEFSLDAAIDCISEFDFDSAENEFNTNFGEFKREFFFGEHMHFLSKLPLFKGVYRLIDGRLKSYWDRSFEYEVGENAIPDNPKHPDSGIYCSKSPNGCYLGDHLIAVEPLNGDELLQQRGQSSDVVLKDGVKVLDSICDKNIGNNNEKVLDYLEAFGYITQEQRDIVLDYFNS